jgi:hypothetical protein
MLLGVVFGNFNSDSIIAPDDYNGDGRADIVVWRGKSAAGADAGAWYIRNTAGGLLLPIFVFGVAGGGSPDVALRGNYDGDDKADIAVYRPSTGQWFWRSSLNGSIGAQQWGSVGDVPLPSLHVY